MGLGRLYDGLAPTPPMGWNSWNCFGTHINEWLIKEIAEAMVRSGMKDAGYQYVVLDDGWHDWTRDARRNLRANPNTFPSGIPALSDYIHALGLKFGIYTDCGTATCQGFPGSLGEEERDAQQFADWGADYVKIDWCYTEGLDAKTQYAKWSEALQKTGHPIVFSICEWGNSQPWLWAPRLGHLWRTTGDIQNSWESVMDILDRQTELHPFAGLGHWNDPDMLEVGNGGMTGEEYRSHFSLWCMLAAPLIAGNDLRFMSEETREILTAKEVIAVNQDRLGIQGRKIKSVDGIEIWSKPLRGADKMAVLLLNRSPLAQDASLLWRELGYPFDAARVRDLWQKTDLGLFGNCFTTPALPPHGCMMLEITPPFSLP